MCMQKNGQAQEPRSSSSEVAAVTRLTGDQAKDVMDPQKLRRTRPVPRLDWPANLFCDALAN